MSHQDSCWLSSGFARQAGHAIIGAHLPEYDTVTKISIIPRGATGGATFFAPNEEQLESGLFTRSYLENKMAVALGGRVAEELILGPEAVTTGASNDFQQVPCCSSMLQMHAAYVMKCMHVASGWGLCTPA